MNDDSSPPPLAINVLGELAFVPGTPALAALKGRARDVLILLVIAWPDESTAKQLSQQLRADPRLDPSTVHKYLGELRDAGVPMRQRGTRPESYSLDSNQVTTDAWRLLDGIDKVSTPEEIDRLARLWRGDPERTHNVSSWQWRRIQKAREKLVQLIEGLDPADRPGDAVLTRIAPDLVSGTGRAAVRRPTRPRVLVIDDLHGETVAYQAMAADIECQCDVIESFPEWLDFRDRVDVGAEYQAALVDLHLEGDPAVDDKLGLRIITWLRDHTELPVAAVSSAPGSGLGRERNQLRAEFRLVEIVDKGRENRYLNEIPQVVRLLLSDADDCRQARLETWLMHAERRLRRAQFDGQISKELLVQALDEHRAANIAVQHGRVDDAAAFVQAFCDTWLGRFKAL